MVRMVDMSASMAYPAERAGQERKAWQIWLGHLCALALSLLFIVSGVWKLAAPIEAAERMAQMQTPEALSMVAALGVGIAEAFGGILILLPRYRRWGAILISVLLVVFMAYIGYFYNTLRGEDCSCFPWLERLVGPWFFISDGLMLVAAAAAWAWSSRPYGKRGPALILAALCVFALVSYGAAAAAQKSVQAPEFVKVDGKDFPLRRGKVVLYFFDPECSHCDAEARKLAKLNWQENTQLVAAAQGMTQYAEAFLKETGLHKSKLTPDTAKLRKKFNFVDPPYAVLLDNGKVVATFNSMQFNAREPEESLRRHGFIR